MVRLEDLTPGVRVFGILPGAVRIIAVHTYGNGAVEITYKDADGEVGQQILYRADESKLGLATVSGPTFDGDGAAFRLAAEALRIRMAGQHDTMLAVTTSDLDPLPHQIKAVYGELLPRVPLRFLLADDPGAGKTIMAGLYVKELALRGDLARCLIVAPGGLVEQWQDELHEKLGLRFELLTTDLIAATPVGEQVQDRSRQDGHLGGEVAARRSAASSSSFLTAARRRCWRASLVSSGSISRA
jgi:SNF2-related domain